MTCEKCKTIQFSSNDISYLNLYSVCWDCDKANWEKGLMSTYEFEKREQRANIESSYSKAK